jgi:hypothetical protein
MREGGRYVVIKAFTNFDGREHPVGEQWTFRGDNFLPYDDGLSLFLTIEGQGERQIRMRWIPGDQGEILDRFRDYVVLTIEKNRSGLAKIDLQLRKRLEQSRFERNVEIVAEDLVEERLD